jgi:L-threonylcarbamoyladenylate synthase
MSNIVPATPPNIARAGEILRAGGLVAFPTETVYGLGANALDPVAVQKIFAAKERPGWDPLIVHVTGMSLAEQLAEGLPATLLARFWPGPLTVVVPKKPCVPDAVTAGRPNVALRMPRHPVAQALLAAAGCPVAAPSANKFGRPSPTRAQHVVDDLGDRVDLILDAGPTEMGVESTVLDCTQSPPVILRPGGVTREELGGLRVAGSVADEVARAGLAGPGMTVKHYAPSVPVELFEARPELERRFAELRGRGKRVAVLTPRAAELFADLRRLEADGAEVILCVLPVASGMGLAVRDRLQRAAGKLASTGGNR